MKISIEKTILKLYRKTCYFKLTKPFYNDLEYSYVLNLEFPCFKSRNPTKSRKIFFFKYLENHYTDI